MISRTLSLLLNGVDFLLVDGEVHGDSGRLDSDTTVLFILSCIRKPHITSLGGGDNTGLGDQGVGKGGLSVIDCTNGGQAYEYRDGLKKTGGSSRTYRER